LAKTKNIEKEENEEVVEKKNKKKGRRYSDVESYLSKRILINQRYANLPLLR